MPFSKKNKGNRKRAHLFGLPSWLAKSFNLLFKVGLFFAIIVFLIASYFWYTACQYDINKVASMPARTVVLDSTGNEFATLHGENRRLIPYEEIPISLKQALYAREDADFETHNGVKITGLVRAAIANAKAGKIKQGGSTLSMQLVKNTYDNRKKSYHRKFLEIALTIRLEMNYNKDQILTHYLNRIYFGAGCYGVEEASLTYFGKKTEDLNLSEASLLAGIIRGPDIFSPFKNPKLAVDQRNQVLKRLLSEGYINEEQYSSTRASDIVFQPKGVKKEANKSYTLQLVNRHLNEILTKDQIENGGLTIETSINSSIVKAVDQLGEVLNRNKDDLIQTAAVIMHPQTGAILAVNGGSDINTHQWNIALDARRPMHSTILPFIYLASLSNGSTPLNDKPHATIQLIGNDKVQRFIQKLQLTDESFELEDITKGTLKTSVLRLATAYSLLQNGGELPHSFIVNSISNDSAELLYKAPEKKTIIARKEHTGAALEIIKNTELHGVHQDIKSENIDAWTVKITPDFVAIIWSSLETSKRIGDNAALIKEKHLVLTEYIAKSLSTKKTPTK